MIFQIERRNSEIYKTKFIPFFGGGKFVIALSCIHVMKCSVVLCKQHAIYL